MKDRLSTYPGRYTAVVDTENIEKGAPFNIVLSRNDEPTVEGTPYNKESVLPDSVAEAICPDVEDPTPADAFNALQTKKAPAGYGCGENSAKAMNWNNHYRNGFYSERSNSPDGNFWYGISCVSSYGEVTNIAFNPNTTNGSTMAIRHHKGTTPFAWEYVNPPMLEGVEYRTTERFNGKPVYAKLINCGALPNATTKSVFASNNIADIVRVDGYLKNTAGYTSKVPIHTTKAVEVSLSGGSYLVFTTTTDQSTWDAYVAVYYTLAE